MKNAEEEVDFVVAIGKVLEFAFETGLGAEFDAANTAETETVDKAEGVELAVPEPKTVAEDGLDVFGFEISHNLSFEVVVAWKSGL